MSIKRTALFLFAASTILVSGILLATTSNQTETSAERIFDDGICAQPEDAPERAVDHCTSLLLNENLTDDQRASVHLYRGRAHYSLDRFDLSLEDFERGLELAADNHKLWDWKSFALEEKGNLSEALAAVEESLLIRPKMKFPVRQKFQLLAELNRADEADVFYVELMRELDVMDRPDLAWMPTQLGKLRASRKQYALATDAFGLALTLDAQNTGIISKFSDACRNAGDKCRHVIPAELLVPSPQDCRRVAFDMLELRPSLGRYINADYGELNLGFASPEDLVYNAVLEYDLAASDLTYRPDRDIAIFFLKAEMLLSCVENGPLGKTPIFESEQKHLRWYGSKYLRPNLVGLAQKISAEVPQDT